MSSIKQLRIDGVNAWCDAFLRDMKIDPDDQQTARGVAQTLLTGERMRGPLMVEESDLQGEDDGLARTALSFCRKFDLPVTASGLAMLILGCFNFDQVLMNVVVAKRQFELVREVSGPLADAQFMMMLFGDGTYTQDFYDNVWTLQEMPEGNLLEMIEAIDFQQTTELVV